MNNLQTKYLRTLSTTSTIFATTLNFAIPYMRLIDISIRRRKSNFHDILTQQISKTRIVILFNNCHSYSNQQPQLRTNVMQHWLPQSNKGAYSINPLFHCLLLFLNALKNESQLRNVKSIACTRMIT